MKRQQIEPTITPTMNKFGHPSTLIADYRWWSVLLRPKAVTLGSLILAAKADVSAFSDLPGEAFSDLAQITGDIEHVLRKFCAYERINYLMLMMVDPEPHFHVIPRYDGSRDWEGQSFPDTGWPGPPALGNAADLSAETIAKMRGELRALWTPT